MIKKFFSILIVSIMLFSLAGFAFAQDRELEIKYPEIEGEQPEQVTTPVPEYFKYIFNFLIWISGLIALVVLVYAGFQYFTSAGNPEAMNDAKNRIGAALLGLLILFGSYLILTTINPELIVFHLPRLRPIMSELSPGVLVCKEEVEIRKSWDLMMEYKLLSPSEDREREIKKELDKALDKIALECYSISGTEDIRSDFDNKIQYIYFIPHIETDGVKITNVVEYGAVAYEEKNFGGKSQVLAYNLIDPQGTADAYGEQTLLKVSSIKPFALIYEPDPNWEVVLYQEYNENKGVGGLTPVYANITTDPDCITSQGQGESSEWWCEFNLSWPPKSMRIEGDLLAILCKDKIELGSCETFFSETENNLEEYDNIVKWVACTDYKNQTIIKEDCIAVGGFGQNVSYMPCCAEAAATKLLIISAKPL